MPFLSLTPGTQGTLPAVTAATTGVGGALWTPEGTFAGVLVATDLDSSRGYAYVADSAAGRVVTDIAPGLVFAYGSDLLSCRNSPSEHGVLPYRRYCASRAGRPSSWIPVFQERDLPARRSHQRPGGGQHAGARGDWRRGDRAKPAARVDCHRTFSAAAPRVVGTPRRRESSAAGAAGVYRLHHRPGGPATRRSGASLSRDRVVR